MNEEMFLSRGGTMGRLMREKDWTGTSLGVPEAWPLPLKSLVEVMLVAVQPMFIAWGPERLFLYNDPYGAVLADKHPGALGLPFLDVLPEVRAELAPLADQVFAGRPVHMDDIALMILRRGVLQEAHFAFSYTPVRDEGGEVAGLFCACVETTDQVMAERRQAFQLSLENELRLIESGSTLPGRSLAALQVLLGVQASGLLRVTGRGTVVDLHKSGDGEAVAGPVLPGQMPRAATLVSDGRTGPAPLAASLGLASLVAVPLVHEGQIRDAFFVGDGSPRHWSPEDVALVEYVAHRISDALERWVAVSALRRSEAHLASIFAQTGAGFAECDADGRFISVNDTYCRLTGRSRRELLSMGKLDVTHAEDRPAARDAIAAVLATGQPATVQKRYLHRDGRVIWVSNTISAIRASNGGRSLLTVAIDISAQKGTERDLAAAKEQADEANLAKSMFLANMSHELRTPLSAIIGYSEMLEEEIADAGDPAGLGADVGKIESNARHLLGLINDVLDLSKIESGKMEVLAEPFVVEELVREVAASMEGLAAKRSNALRMELDTGLGAADTDAVKVRQVLFNLLSNATKFTENGTVVLSVAREADPAGDSLVFRVGDSGIGMTPDQLARLFERFTQADASTTRRFGGTGLGLSITKAFVTMLGGTVAVDSVFGEGTTFTVRLPATLPAALRSIVADPAVDPVAG